MKDQEVLRVAIDTYGIKAQTDMIIEEMSELTKALLKHRRNPTSNTLDNIKEEMADVQIMLDQMKLFYGDDSEYRAKKIVRLARRLCADEDTDAGGLVPAT